MKSLPAYLFLMIALCITCIACDPGVSYNSVIENHSGHDIMIYIYQPHPPGGPILYEKDSFLVQSHSEVSLFEDSGLGQTADYNSCDTYADSIHTRIIGNNSLELAMDLNNSDVWTFREWNTTRHGGGSCECRVLIYNENIH